MNALRDGAQKSRPGHSMRNAEDAVKAHQQNANDDSNLAIEIFLHDE
jgi:hypothetical protein